MNTPVFTIIAGSSNHAQWTGRLVVCYHAEGNRRLDYPHFYVVINPARFFEGQITRGCVALSGELWKFGSRIWFKVPDYLLRKYRLEVFSPITFSDRMWTNVMIPSCTKSASSSNTMQCRVLRRNVTAAMLCPQYPHPCFVNSQCTHYCCVHIHSVRIIVVSTVSASLLCSQYPHHCCPTLGLRLNGCLQPHIRCSTGRFQLGASPRLWTHYLELRCWQPRFTSRRHSYNKATQWCRWVSLPASWLPTWPPIQGDTTNPDWSTRITMTSLSAESISRAAGLLLGLIEVWMNEPMYINST